MWVGVRFECGWVLGLSLGESWVWVNIGLVWVDGCIVK